MQKVIRFLCFLRVPIEFCMHFPAHKLKSWVLTYSYTHTHTHTHTHTRTRTLSLSLSLSLSLFLFVTDTSSYSRIRDYFLIISRPVFGSKSDYLNSPKNVVFEDSVLLRHGALPISKVSLTFPRRLQSCSLVLTYVYRPTGDGGKKCPP